MSLQLVQLGLTNAAMFGANGEVLQPSEVLRKRAVLVERGSFRPVCNSNIDIMRCAHERFCREPGVEPDSVIQIMETSMRAARRCSRAKCWRGSGRGTRVGRQWCRARLPR